MFTDGSKTASLAGCGIYFEQLNSPLQSTRMRNLSVQNWSVFFVLFIASLPTLYQKRWYIHWQSRRITGQR